MLKNYLNQKRYKNVCKSKIVPDNDLGKVKIFKISISSLNKVMRRKPGGGGTLCPPPPGNDRNDGQGLSLVNILPSRNIFYSQGDSDFIHTFVGLLLSLFASFIFVWEVFPGLNLSNTGQSEGSHKTPGIVTFQKHIHRLLFNHNTKLAI